MNEAIDLFGSTKELGPENGTDTKVGVIHTAVPPMLGLTNSNPQVDLRAIWTSTKRDGDGHIWMYLSFERDSNNGSGFLAFEFMRNAVPDGCTYADANGDPTEPDPATCNPWSARSGPSNGVPGDFMVVWDQQGGSSTDLGIRYFDGTQFGAVETIPATQGAAAFGTTTGGIGSYKGEAAIDLTALYFGQTQTCTSIRNIIPNTVTGNSDSADYKDTIFHEFPPISNCGTVTINKTVQNAPTSADSFGFTTTGGLDADPDTSGVQSTFNLTNGGTLALTDVPVGNYTVVEDASLPDGYDFVSLECSSSGTGTSASPSTPTANTTATIHLEILGDVVCTYTNHYTNPTSITTQIKKVSDNSNVASGGSVVTGTAVYDTATLSGATANAGGSVTYHAYARDPNALDTPKCTGTDLFGNGSGDAVTVTNGVVPKSANLTLPIGEYDFQAVYTGDANNAGSTSVCGTEHLVIDKAPASLTTTQKWRPQDSVTVAATAGGTPTGTVDFKLYDNATCTGSPVFEQNGVALSGGQASTTNSTYDVSATKTVYWLVSYSGDASHKAIAGSCGDENTALTINNGGTVNSQ